MSADKVATATLEDADWTFVGMPEVMAAVNKAARKAVSRFDGQVEYDDAHQDALLWLAVRPALVAKARREDDFGSLAERIYANALRPDAKTESDRQSWTVSRDAYIDKVE